MLNLVSDIDEEVRAQTLVQTRGDKVVECNESLLEVFSLHVRKPLQHQLENGDEVRLKCLWWQVGNYSLNELEGIALVCLGRDELLENTEYRLHLLILDDVLRIARDHGTKKACKGWYVASLLPDGSLEDDCEQTPVVCSQLASRVCL
jgi:hypothetical protein